MPLVVYNPPHVIFYLISSPCVYVSLPPQMGYLCFMYSCTTEWPNYEAEVKRKWIPDNAVLLNDASQALYTYVLHFRDGVCDYEQIWLSITINKFIHSIGVCRMWWFLAVLRSFFHSSLLCTFSGHPSPPTNLPSSLTSSCHLFLGYLSVLLFPNSYIIPFWEYYFLPFSVHAQTNVIYLTISSQLE